MTHKDLEDLALRLDDDEKFSLRYRWPKGGRASAPIQYEERTDPLLDVAEEMGVLFVSQEGIPMKVLLAEALEVLPNGK